MLVDGIRRVPRVRVTVIGRPVGIELLGTDEGKTR